MTDYLEILNDLRKEFGFKTLEETAIYYLNSDEAKSFMEADDSFLLFCEDFLNERNTNTSN